MKLRCDVSESTVRFFFFFLSDLRKSLSLKAVTCLRREPFSNRTVSCSSVARALPQLWDFNTVPPMILKCFKCRHKHHTAPYRRNTGAMTQVFTVLIISKRDYRLVLHSLQENTHYWMGKKKCFLIENQHGKFINGLDLEKAFTQVLWGMYVYKIARILMRFGAVVFPHRERK